MSRRIWFDRREKPRIYKTARGEIDPGKFLLRRTAPHVVLSLSVSLHRANELLSGKERGFADDDCITRYIGYNNPGKRILIARVAIYAGLRLLLRQVLSFAKAKKSAVRRHSRMPSSRRGVPPLSIEWGRKPRCTDKLSFLADIFFFPYSLSFSTFIARAG